MNKYFLLVASALLVNQVSYGMEEALKDYRMLSAFEIFFTRIKNYSPFQDSINNLDLNSYDENVKLIPYEEIIKGLDGKKLPDHVGLLDLAKKRLNTNLNKEKIVTIGDLNAIKDRELNHIETSDVPNFYKEQLRKELEKSFNKKALDLKKQIALQEYNTLSTDHKNEFDNLIPEIKTKSKENIVALVAQQAHSEFYQGHNKFCSSLGSGSRVNKKKLFEKRSFLQKHGGKVLATGALAFAGGAYWWYKSK